MEKQNNDVKTSTLEQSGGERGRQTLQEKKKLIKKGPLIPQAQKSTARNLLPPLSQAGGGGGVHNPISREMPSGFSLRVTFLIWTSVDRSKPSSLVSWDS